MKPNIRYTNPNFLKSLSTLMEPKLCVNKTLDIKNLKKKSNPTFFRWFNISLNRLICK